MHRSEFRKDIVSGEWILVAGGRVRRPTLYVQTATDGAREDETKTCPFDDPQASGNPLPVAWYPAPDSGKKQPRDLSSWFVQVIPNKYPIVAPHDKAACPVMEKDGPYERVAGVGAHEVIITRPHRKTLGQMSAAEAEVVLRAYQDRYRALGAEPCVRYILVFHNSGEMAGASIPHPHSQLVALPIIPPDVARSFRGSQSFFQKHGTCAHCVILAWERKQKLRVLFQTPSFIVLMPYASRVSFEIRIFPKRHGAHFEEIGAAERMQLAGALVRTLATLRTALRNPDYNFFIHTRATESAPTNHYHWHVEILPRTARWAGLELGTGIEVVAVPPEAAAAALRKHLAR